VKKTMALCALVVVSLANVKAEDVEYEYEVSNRAYDFAGAQSYCESGFGGQVTSITSQAERNLIHNLAKAKGTGNYWIGAERVGSSDSWSYVDGETVKVTFQGNSVWAWKEPNNRKGKENCIIVRGSGLYEAKWNDAKCSMNARTVCKRVKQANPYVGDGWHNRADDGGSKMCYYKYFNRVLYKKEAPYRRRSWFDAEGFCNGQVNGGGHLVSINSASEQTWVQNLIYTTYNDFENRPVWIGGRRSANSWEEWTDGKQMTFTNWMPGEPSTDVNSRDGDEEERCMQMSHSHIAGGYKKTGGDNPGEDIKNTVGKKGQWNDAACSKTRGFLCEICTDEF